jgi:hypothetical protein
MILIVFALAVVGLCALGALFGADSHDTTAGRRL